MSVDATRLVWERSKASSGALLVMLALADHANAKGEAWPSVTRLASLCRMSGRNVLRHLAALEEAGEVRREVSQGRPTHYIITLTHDAHVTSDADVTHDAHVTPPMTPTSPTHDAHVTRTVKNHHRTIINGENGENLFGDSLPEKHVAEVIAEAWNRMAGEHGLPKALKVDDARKATWKRRVEEAGGVKAIIAAIEAIPESDLLCGRIKGRDGQQPFRASLDWIAKPANWKKLAEGNYHGGRPPRPRETTGETREQMLARQMAMREKMNGAIR